MGIFRTSIRPIEGHDMSLKVANDPTGLRTRTDREVRDQPSYLRITSNSGRLFQTNFTELRPEAFLFRSDRSRGVANRLVLTFRYSLRGMFSRGSLAIVMDLAFRDLRNRSQCSAHKNAKRSQKIRNLRKDGNEVVRQDENVPSTSLSKATRSPQDRLPQSTRLESHSLMP